MARGLYTISQLADRFLMTEAALYRLIEDGEEPYRRLNQYVSADQKKRFYKSQRVATFRGGRSTQG
jgi:hypothetical protein